MKSKKRILAFALLAISFGMISCGNNSTTDISNENKEEVVVSTSVAITEILDALGVKVAGVPTSSYELPESARDAVKVGNPMSPDLEIIKSLNPTVVVSVDTLGSDYMNLFEQNNIPSEFVSLSSLDSLKESIEILGNRFNKTTEAKELVNKIESKENEVSSIENKSNQDIMIIFAAPGSTMLATQKSYIGNLVELVGGNNIVDDNSSPFVTYSKEYLATLNPDKILVMVHALPEETKAALQKEMVTDSMWQRIDAVREGKIEYLDSNYFGMSANLKIVEALDILSGIVNDNEE